MPNAAELALLALQSFHVVFLLLHDWIPLGRLNDPAAVRRENSLAGLIANTLIARGLFAFGLGASIHYYGSAYPGWLQGWLFVSYGLLFLGELRAWWIPYLVHAEPQRAARYRAMFGWTHTFLPVRKWNCAQHFAYHSPRRDVCDASSALARLLNVRLYSSPPLPSPRGVPHENRLYLSGIPSQFGHVIAAGRDLAWADIYNKIPVLEQIKTRTDVLRATSTKGFRNAIRPCRTW
jgi:hypothetical protein